MSSTTERMEIAALQHDALACLDQTPSEAIELAHRAYALSRASPPDVQAETALTLAIVLNRLGEFSQVSPLCDFATNEFLKLDQHDQSARALIESAWTDTFIGDINPATTTIERARAMTSSPLILARCDWVQACVLRDQAHYPESIALFEKVRDKFQAAQLPLDVARCERDLANVFIYSERGEAFPLLERLKKTFEATNCFLDAALCEYWLGIALAETGQHPAALGLQLRAREIFAHLRVVFFVAWSNQALGISYRHLNRFDESLKVLHQARDYFLAHNIRANVSACDINLGNVYYMLNRYDEALALYQEAADLSAADGREVRAARIYTNIGLVYFKQGLYAKALDVHHRVLQIGKSKKLAVLAAGNHGNLAACYRQLGQYDEALAHLQESEKLVQSASGERLVAQRIDLADLHLARGKTTEAVACLEQARDAAVADGLDSYVAVCDRLLAQATAQTVSKEQSLERIENARMLFLKHAQTVDAALCDLTEAELRLEWGEIEAAQNCFHRAQAVLSPAFPDQAWRTNYGLGRCAAATDDNAGALDHSLHAVRTIAASRSILVTEQISNDFFARRQSVFDDALSIALRQGAMESALEVIEASKARTFLTALTTLRRDWNLRDVHADPHISDLIVREKELRYQLDVLRKRVAVQAVQGGAESLRGSNMLAASAAELQELNALSQAYEAVVTQLRLATAGLAGISVPAPFALEHFRNAANTAFGSDWTALDYYLADDVLTVAVVTPHALNVERKTLSPYDRAILDNCTSSEPDLRELIYRGTLHGMTAPTPGANYLKHVYRLLMPQDLGATLIISPHGLLHALPFHALIAPQNEKFLIEQHTLLYSPNLQALQVLLNESVDGTVKQPLVVGVSNFGDGTPALPSAAVEVDRVRQAFAGHGQTLVEQDATRRKLLELDTSGELQKFDVLHFATHAVLDGVAPHQSRILLSDDALSVTDILDLTLNARLVTLSACQTALGKSGHGDELIGLARAFFYAGARALLVTLWRVEDQAMVDLTERFYRHLVNGDNAAVALRNAQVEMIHAGSPPYHWAPFVLIGRP